ncbi:hypothetical protein SNE40_008473 [Patella caerulea]|uniref:CCHC-type domain-containing protein n=1 Tax=Patella caerulea TaxID=87958 RepID=A0AAN8QAF0_PATCE
MNTQKPRLKGTYAANVTNVNRSSNPTNSLSSHRMSHYQTQRTPSSNQEKCIHCLRTHSVGNCKEFETLPHHEKLNILRMNGRCFGCLEKGHMRNQCENRIQCSHCEFRHPSFL